MSSPVVIFGSGKPVTCAVMDYSYRLAEAVNRRVPGLVSVRTVEPSRPAAFIGAIAGVLRRGGVAHFELPVEGWGNALLPGSALMAARLLTRRGRIVTTLHEWTSLNRLRYLSMIPDLLATDEFIFVSARQRESFRNARFIGKSKRDHARLIPIGPNIMPKSVDPSRIAQERMRLIGSGAGQADLVIGFFGVLYASKRPDLLLRTIAALHAEGVKARLLICGDFLWDKPQDRAAFMSLAAELGLAAWLDFRGRIEDESELMAALAASDVFLLPYADGVSARRGSFQAVSNLAIPLVSTLPEQAGEFDGSPLLAAKINNPATILRPSDSSPDIFAKAILAAHARKGEAKAVDLSALWDEAAEAHLALYRDALGSMAAGLRLPVSFPAE
jgi:glycosyltransferase involved in cell wall biosynthesis